LNTGLLERAVNLTKGLTLNDSSTAIEYRKKFDYAPANEAPVVTQCDVFVLFSSFSASDFPSHSSLLSRSVTSDAYWAGTLLAETWGNFTSLLTNGTGVYCNTAQEDNASLEAMVR
jgi:purine nucleoside permease